MASMRDIKRRRNSISSTGQITKAMKLVATSKLQKAKMRAEQTRPYFNHMHSTIASILASSEGISHPYLTNRDGEKSIYIVITSNSGLAGGYNGNVCKAVINNVVSKENTSIIAIGKRGRDIFKRNDYHVLYERNEVADGPTYRNAVELAEDVLKRYRDGEVDHVYIAYTYFASTISQEAKVMKVLPLSKDTFSYDSENEDNKEKALKSIMTFEPGAEDVLDIIIPKYISSLLFGALRESIASEHGARMTAMDSATKNAEDMIADLTLQYNRARQASITQELSEIVSGAEALK